MQTVRRITQLIFLFFFIYLFFKAMYPYEITIPSDIFLRSDPLVALITILATKKLIFLPFLLAFIVLIFTLIFGRFFCGWICPLGTTIDGSDYLTRRLRKAKRPAKRNYRLWKYSLFIGIVIAAFFSVQLIWLLDPISLLTRSMTIVLYPLFAYFVETTLNILIGIGLFQDTLFSFYDSLRGSILPLEPIIFHQGIIIFIIFLLILLVGALTKRFWCRYLCPLGALLSLSSKFRIFKLTVDDKCIDCGRCYRECKMDAINDDYRTSSQLECIECMNCVTICPTKAIDFKLRFLPKPVKTDISRRRFIVSGLTGIAAVGLTRTAFKDKNVDGNVIRPPGSLSEAEFLNRCVRCHECIKICSTTGRYLQPTLLESGWEGIWTPRGDARRGYCEFNCNLCGQVCPTGAIQPIDLELKKKLTIGTAYFDKSRCIPWYRQEDCLVCEEHCPVPEKAIKFDIHLVEQRDGTTKEVKFPRVIEDLCIGCGICVTKCPVIGSPGIFVTNSRQQRWN
jgi:polyferredoxin/Fe-S-cluster-containing dehydrogenase component